MGFTCHAGRYANGSQASTISEGIITDIGHALAAADRPQIRASFEHRLPDIRHAGGDGD